MRVLLLVIAFGCISCAPERFPVEISFAATSNGTTINCGDSNSAVRLNDLRFYVSNVKLQDADGTWHPVDFTPDDVWQSDQVVLIDLEDGQGACLNGSVETNAVIRGAVGVPTATGLSFDIGVPENLNHNDPLLAGPPLGYTIMHWHWASGYKFLRAGVETDNDSFFLHLGSNRCEGTIGRIEGCRASNRAAVTLDDFDPSKDVVTMDVGRLFAGVDLADSENSECMSGPTNPVCEAVFTNLGIDFDSGESTGSAPAVGAVRR